MGIIRILLTISVIVSHSTPIPGLCLPDGETAVQAFFIISGFYMSLVLNEKYTEKKALRHYLKNRFLKIYPVYWCVLLLTLSFSLAIFLKSHGSNTAGFTYYAEYGDSMSPATFLFLIFTNIFIFFQDIVMFLGLNTSTGELFFTANFRETLPMLYDFLFIPQAWTIGVELMFYLIDPFLVRRKLKIIVLFIAVSLLLRLALYHYGLYEDPWSYRVFPNELALFLCGTVAYHIYRRLPSIDTGRNYLMLIYGCILLLIVTFEMIPVVFLLKKTVFLAVFAIALPFIFQLWKRSAKDRYIGELSYPVYISHLLIKTCLVAIGIQTSGLYLAAATIFFSIILNETLTKRITKYKSKG